MPGVEDTQALLIGTFTLAVLIILMLVLMFLQHLRILDLERRQGILWSAVRNVRNHQVRDTLVLQAVNQEVQDARRRLDLFRNRVPQPSTPPGNLDHDAGQGANRRLAHLRRDVRNGEVTSKLPVS